MDSLDLTKKPPRSPYELCGGLLLLARTIDKIRATLPGGNPGAYRVRGFSKQLLERLGIEEDDLRAVVALATSDGEVAAWVQRHSDAAAYAQINQTFESETIANRPDPEAYFTRYPIARTLPPETPLLRVLELDDAQSFAQ
ncbi:MAG TPA: DUF5069 domain-containing protein [Candidatus Baltobacteraceae bacterium]|nr:DUF5069 domain-containing protein [Candidatus Baltobacteraceae bacterium]